MVSGGYSESKSYVDEIEELLVDPRLRHLVFGLDFSIDWKEGLYESVAEEIRKRLRNGCDYIQEDSYSAAPEIKQRGGEEVTVGHVNCRGTCIVGGVELRYNWGVREEKPLGGHWEICVEAEIERPYKTRGSKGILPEKVFKYHILAATLAAVAEYEQKDTNTQ